MDFQRALDIYKQAFQLSQEEFFEELGRKKESDAD